MKKAITTIYPNTTTDLHYGIFKIIDLVHRVAAYLENCYCPFLCDILDRPKDPIGEA